MTKSNDGKPSRSASSGAGREERQKPGPALVNANIFGRFVGNLARLEGRTNQGSSDKGSRR